MAEDTTGRTREQTKPARAPVGAGGKERLVYVLPQSLALPVPLASETFGRGWLSDHGIDDDNVSGRHCRFLRPGGGLHIEDLRSRNGTWVNGTRLTPNEPVGLDDGAIVRMGKGLAVYRKAFRGSDSPSPPVGSVLVGPWGLRSVEDRLSRIAHGGAYPLTVLIVGDTGTGKEALAKAVAQARGRAERYEAVNMAALPANLFESELFGYVSGAFSGAGRGFDGVLFAHNGGAVFLDEIGELGLDLQAKLLRVIENGEVRQVGAKSARKLDLLLIAATNRPLERMVSEGTFRADLLARFQTVRIDVPRLAARAEDIFAIAGALAERRGQPYEPGKVAVQAVERLLREPWTMNVRELDAQLRRVEELDPGGLQVWAVEQVLGPATHDTETALTEGRVRAAVLDEGGNKAAAARRLGVSRGKVIRKMRGE